MQVGKEWSSFLPQILASEEIATTTTTTTTTWSAIKTKVDPTGTATLGWACSGMLQPDPVQNTNFVVFADWRMPTIKRVDLCYCDGGFVVVADFCFVRCYAVFVTLVCRLDMT